MIVCNDNVSPAETGDGEAGARLRSRIRTLSEAAEDLMELALWIHPAFPERDKLQDAARTLLDVADRLKGDAGDIPGEAQA